MSAVLTKDEARDIVNSHRLRISTLLSDCRLNVEMLSAALVLGDPEVNDRILRADSAIYVAQLLLSTEKSPVGEEYIIHQVARIFGPAT